jgi:hypothetical protein
MPAKAGTHASFRKRNAERVAQSPAEAIAEAGVDPGLRRDDV